MSRLIGLALGITTIIALSACPMTLPVPGMGGGASAYKPTTAMSNQFTGDLTGAKVGQYAAYTSEAGGSKTTTTIKVVGTSGDSTWVEQWMDAGTMTYGYLFAVGKDKKISKAYAAAKGDTAWTEIKVNEPPKPAEAKGDAPKPKVVEGDEKKTVTAGEFAAHKIETTVNVQGKDYTSTAWYAKDAPTLYVASDKGGLVAMEGSGSKTWLEAKGDDAKPTLDLPGAPAAK